MTIIPPPPPSDPTAVRDLGPQYVRPGQSTPDTFEMLELGTAWRVILMGSISGTTVLSPLLE